MPSNPDSTGARGPCKASHSGSPLAGEHVMTVFSSLSPPAIVDKMLYVSDVWIGIHVRRSSRVTSEFVFCPREKHEVPFRWLYFVGMAKMLMLSSYMPFGYRLRNSAIDLEHAAASRNIRVVSLLIWRWRSGERRSEYGNLTPSVMFL